MRPTLHVLRLYISHSMRIPLIFAEYGLDNRIMAEIEIHQ